MRKLLIIFMSNIIVVPTVSGVVACMPQNNSDPKTIGLGIDKSKAIDDGIKDNKVSKYTNYFIVGDSLSDVDGITNYLESRAEPLIKQLFGEIDFAGLKIEPKIHLALDGAGYGFADKQNNHRSAFSNGATAGYLLGEKLGFENLKSSNYFNVLSEKQTSYGKNYSVGGATAAHLDTTMGAVLNDATVEKQTAALIQQHKIGANDLTFFEIGGNDLFAMIDNYSNQKEVERIFITGIKALRKGLFTLLNNGVKKVIFMTPPKMNLVPKYRDLFLNPTPENSAKRTFIDEIGQQYQAAILEVLQEVEGYYPKQVTLYDLFNEFENIIKWFKESTKNAVVDKQAVNKEGTFVLADKNDSLIGAPTEYIHGSYKSSDHSLVTLSDAIEQVSSLIKLKDAQTRVKRSPKAFEINLQLVMLADIVTPNRNIDDYFFVDQVHPSAAVHEYVSELLLNKLKTS